MDISDILDIFSTVKMGMQNKNIEKLHLSSLAPVKQSQIEKPKTKLVISSKQEYPITTAFPYTLETLRVCFLAFVVLRFLRSSAYVYRLYVWHLNKSFGEIRMLVVYSSTLSPSENLFGIGCLCTVFHLPIPLN